MFCSKCGAQIADDSKFCYKCGTGIEATPTPTTITEEDVLPIYDASGAVPTGNCKHLSTDETKKYLQYVKKLELYLHTLDQIMTKNYRKIDSLGIGKTYDEPKLLGYLLIRAPYMLFGGGIVALLALIIILFGPGRSFGDLLFDLIFNLEIIIAPLKAIPWGLLGALIAGVIGAVVAVIEYKQDTNSYHDNLSRDIRRVDKEFEQMEQLEKQNDKLKREYEKANNLLEELYDMNVLFPKYRELVTVTTLCEYFEAERCFDLTGPSGAYNIYEYEIRQNIIISKLDEVINKLDQLKNNQYALYQAIQESNMISAEICEQNDQLISQNRTISQNTAASAYYSKLAADYSMISAYYSIK